MTRRGLLVAGWLLATCGTPATAHDGPPFPIVSDRRAGPYVVSIWTDPDATDDGTAGGQFWVQVRMADAAAVPPATRATVGVRPLTRPAAERSAATEPVRGDPTNQFVAVVMDHEGRFAVEAALDGPAGPALVEAEVDATYDLRPAPFMLALYAVPFVLAGLLWARLLLKRHSANGL